MWSAIGYGIGFGISFWVFMVPVILLLRLDTHKQERERLDGYWQRSVNTGELQLRFIERQVSVLREIADKLPSQEPNESR